MQKFILNEFNTLAESIKSLDLKVITIFLSVVILQTISWYFSNPNYINQNILYNFLDDGELEEFSAYFLSFIGDFILFFIIPLLIIEFLFGEKIKFYGLQLGNTKVGLFFFIISILVITPILILLSTIFKVNDFSPMKDMPTLSYNLFNIYILLLLLFLFAWEFIWRGFMLFGLEKKFGIHSIFIQMIPFVILHNGKPIIETFSSIFGALFLGYLAIRTRSFLYGFLIHSYIIVFLEIYYYLKF